MSWWARSEQELKRMAAQLRGDVMREYDKVPKELQYPAVSGICNTAADVALLKAAGEMLNAAESAPSPRMYVPPGTSEIQGYGWARHPDGVTRLGPTKRNEAGEVVPAFPQGDEMPLDKQRVKYLVDFLNLHAPDSAKAQRELDDAKQTLQAVLADHRRLERLNADLNADLATRLEQLNTTVDRSYSRAEERHTTISRMLEAVDCWDDRYEDPVEAIQSRYIDLQAKLAKRDALVAEYEAQPPAKIDNATAVGLEFQKLRKQLELAEETAIERGEATATLREQRASLTRQLQDSERLEEDVEGLTILAEERLDHINALQLALQLYAEANPEPGEDE